MTGTEEGPAVRRLRSASSSRVPLLFLLVVVAGIVAAVLVQQLRSGDGEQSAEQAALRVARERAVQITSYTPQTYDRDVAWARDGATASFAAEYARANRPLRTVVQKVRASAVGHVVAASATARDDDRVTVLLFVDQTVTHGTTRKQTTQHDRVEMSMLRRDGTWLVDDVRLR